MVNAMFVIHVIYFINALPVISCRTVLKRLTIVQMTKELLDSFSIQCQFIFFFKYEITSLGNWFQNFKAIFMGWDVQEEFCTTGGCVDIQGWCTFFPNTTLDIPTTEDGPLHCLKMLGTDYLLMWCHISQEKTSQLHNYKNQKTCIHYYISKSPLWVPMRQMRLNLISYLWFILLLPSHLCLGLLKWTHFSSYDSLHMSHVYHAYCMLFSLPY